MISQTVRRCDDKGVAYDVSALTRRYQLRWPRGISLPLNSKPAEGGIFFADFERCLIVCAIEPGLHCVQAVPSLNSNSLWRCTLQSGHRLSSNARYSSYYYEATAGRFDRRLSLWGELFCVSIGICDIDFSDEINGRFRLSVKSLNSRTTESGSCDH